MHSGLQYPAFMFGPCGQPGHSLHTSLCVNSAAVHRAGIAPERAVHKLPSKPDLIPLSTLFLYTVYEQLLAVFASVNQTLVHTIHRAYIYETNSNKGIN